jgi:hypothetical protein
MNEVYSLITCLLKIRGLTNNGHFLYLPCLILLPEWTVIDRK